VAESQWSIGIQYEADLGSAGSITPRFDVSYQGAIVGNPTVPAKGSPSDLFATTPSFTLANARLTWRNAPRDLDVSFEVTNLFEEYYFLSKFDLTGPGGGYITGLPGRPREWALSAKKKF
jgi:iron complex outermembrane receptor protein